MNAQAEDRRKRFLINLTATLAATAAATIARFAMASVAGPGVPFITYFVAALILAWYCGFFSATLCVVLGSIVGSRYFLVHDHPGTILATSNDWTAVIGYAIVALLVSLLLHLLRTAFERNKAAENAERQQRRWFEATLASIGDAVITTGLDGRVVHANSVAQAMLGWTESDMSGRPLDDFFHVIDEVSGEKLESPVPAVMKTGKVVGLPERSALKGRDGRTIPIDDTAAPIRNAEGRITGTVLVFRDVTARRRAEETVHLLASIVESSQDAIITHDLSGRFTSWNQGAERIFGYSAGEMIGQPASRIAKSETEDEVPDVLRRIQAGQPVDQYQAVRRTKSGQLIDVSITFSPIYDEMGRISGLSKIARDISSQVRAAEQLAQVNSALKSSNERLARFNEDLERFAFVASHDLQEPLRMMTVYSQLLVRSFPGQPNGDVSKYIEYMTGGARRMRELLADLLAFAELGARGEQPTASTDLNLVLDKVTQNLKASIDETGATVSAERLPVVNVYEGHFIALFQNLISNAIKYRGTEKPEVRVFVEQNNGDWRFGVADNGIGIEREYLDRIFVPFKRLHGGDIPGSGIGLAICQRVIERYGGRIWAESEAGRGSTFLFTLPQVPRGKAEDY
jgi:PAS domain S-box-containing protein